MIIWVKKEVNKLVTFGSRISLLAKKLGKEHQELARDLGLSKAQLSHYTTGKRKVPSELLQKIVDTYGINPEFLFKEDAPLYMTRSSSQEINMAEYPILPTSISAGLPLSVDPINENDIETIAIPDHLMGKWAKDKDIFFMKINGDSMNNIMQDGALVAVKPVKIHHLKNGDIVVYSVGGDYAIKRFFQRGNKIIFKPDSKDVMFSDFETLVDNEDLKIHGKVVLYFGEIE